jgi:DNA-binding transcriptional regulator YiaG
MAPGLDMFSNPIHSTNLNAQLFTRTLMTDKKGPPKPKFPPCTPELIRAARMAIGYSIKECAKLVHVSDEHWASWESGQNRMPGGVWRLFRILTGMDEVPPLPPPGTLFPIIPEK